MDRQRCVRGRGKDSCESTCVLYQEPKLIYIQLATSQPLCLDPDPHLTRIVNSVLRMSTPTIPPSLKRKATAMEPEEDGPEKARRSRIISFMAPQNNKSHMPRLDRKFLNEFVSSSSNMLCALVIVFWTLSVPFGLKVTKLGQCKQARHLWQAIST